VRYRVMDWLSFSTFTTIANPTASFSYAQHSQESLGLLCGRALVY